MKISLQIIILFISCSSFAQNYWDPIYFPDTLNSWAINAEKDNILFVSTAGINEFHGLFRSIDDGLTWELLDGIPSYATIFSIKYNSDGILFLGTGNGIYRSYDDGDNLDIAFASTNNVLKINFSPSNEIYAVGWYRIFRSSDNGNNWDTLFIANCNQYFSDIDFGLNGEIYVVGGAYYCPGSGFHRSLDNGETWENIGITELHLNSIRVNENGKIIVGCQEGVYTSYTRGWTWTYVSNISAEVMESDEGDNLYAGCYINNGTGCWFSEDWGESWVSLVDNVINPKVHQISLSANNHIYTESRTYYPHNNQLCKSINSILNIPDSESPDKIMLSPNPASDALSVINKTLTRIRQYVIYDVNGKKVQFGNLLDNNINLSNLKPGLYFIELISNKWKIRRKLIIKY